MKYIIILALLLINQQLLSATGGEDNHVPEKPVLTSLESFKLNNQNYLAFTMRHEDGWHTYWKNPGDAGLPTKVKIEESNPDY